MKMCQVLVLIFLSAHLVGCRDQIATSEQVSPQSTVHVIPVPELDQSDSSDQQVDAIVVNKDGTMQQTEYQYDPDQGGVVINNYEEVSGDGSSIFFPALEVGFLWWGGYWVDNEGNYWNGHHYEHVQNPNWDDHWHHYWHDDWNHKWNDYRGAHSYNGNRDRGAEWHKPNHNFNHQGGVNRPSYQRGGPRGGPRGGGHGGGGRR